MTHNNTMTSDLLFDIFIKNKNSKISDLEIFKSGCNNIQISEFENMILLSSVSDHKCRFVIYNKNTLKQIVTFYNNIILDDDAINILSKNKNLNNMIITKYSLDSVHLCLFNNDDKWYIAYSGSAYKYNSDNPTITIFRNIFESKCILENLNKTMSYHLLLKDDALRKLGFSNDKNNTQISLLWINDENLNIIDDNTVTNIGIEKERQINFENLDELLSSLEIINKIDVVNKILSSGGYHIKIHNGNTYEMCLIRTNIYKHIKETMPKYENKYINYLELYQNNMLNDMLPYLNKYPGDIIKRINMSIKTLSKEILNVYHLTRKKQNTDIYDCLPQSYKKILYNLHKIYVSQKYSEIHSTELLKEKKAISVEIVYGFLKKINCNDLLLLFTDRCTLINNLDKIKCKYDKFIYINDIDLKTQIALMTL